MTDPNLAEAHAAIRTCADDPSSAYRRRLLFRAWHRGTQESDLILGRFADSCLAGMNARQLSRFEALLDCPDPDLFDWIIAGIAPPVEHDHEVLAMLYAFWIARDRGITHAGPSASPAMS